MCAGAVEHIGNWGNDDTTYDDAYFLGGRPWEAAQRYHDEAAIFQIDKVRMPTDMVAGADDIRVAVLERSSARHALTPSAFRTSCSCSPAKATRCRRIWYRQNQSARRTEVAARIWRRARWELIVCHSDNVRTCFRQHPSRSGLCDFRSGIYLCNIFLSRSL